MPITDEQLNGLRSRMRHFIDERRDPIVALSGEEMELLQELHNDNPQQAGQLERALRDHAINNPDESQRWSAYAARAIGFQEYRDAARLYRAQRMELIRTSQNVVRLRARGRGNAAQANVPLETLTPEAMLEMNSPRMRAVGLLLKERDGRIWADMFANQYMSDWDGTEDSATIAPKALDSEFFLNVALWFAQKDPLRLGNVSVKPFVMDCVAMAAIRDKRNAPRDWLNELAWDGVERLSGFLSRAYGAEDTEFNRAAGRCWFVGMVARILTPGCQLDTMPVLIGPQGIYKSQSLIVIGGDWYHAASSSIHQKDFLQELWGVLVLEIPELHSLVTSNASAAKAKAVISIRVDHFRKSYGYAPDVFRRTVVMVGTTNNRDWHHDETGGRRFWPIHCGHIDLDWIRESRDQLFAEARAYFSLPPLESGERDPRSEWWNVPREAQRELIERESGENAWENMIAAQLDRTGSDAPKIYGRDATTIVPWDGVLGDGDHHWGTLLTVQRIALSWLRLNTETAGKRITANNIGAIMRGLGWHRVMQRVHGTDKRVRIWLPTADEIAEDAPNDSTATAEPVTDDNDIPF